MKIQEKAAEIEQLSNEALCIEIQKGSQAAKAQILKKNIGMVRAIAQRERRRYAYLSVESEDLWAAGQMGLLRAAQLFSAANGNGFLTYAWMHVRQAVQREIINGGTMIHFPVYLHDRMHKISIYREPYSGVNYRYLEQRIAAGEAKGGGIPEPEIRECLRLMEPMLLLRSLNEPVSMDGETQRQDLLEDEKVESPEQLVLSRMLLDSCLKQLTPRERELIRLRFGLNGCQRHTLVEIGEKLYITKERARQLEIRALEKMRSWANL